MMVRVATFYGFVALGEGQRSLVVLQQAWKQAMLARAVTGTILVTPEGVNATIAGPAAGVEEMLALVREQAGLPGLVAKYSDAAVNPFPKTKVKVKRETIPLGVAVDPQQRGEYVRAADWNALLADPEVVVIDTRNDYEVALGRFVGARNPATQTFKQLPAWLAAQVPDKNQPIAMYCTGGIRCEKSTAYLKAQGYARVYHLEGGILQYLEQVPAAESRWEGACYVFDDRVAVDHALQPVAGLQVCAHCTMPMNAAEVKRGRQAPGGRVVCAACDGARARPQAGIDNNSPA
jgi:UPF0176 protein